jgi:uncharacterized protein YciI
MSEAVDAYRAERERNGLRLYLVFSEPRDGVGDRGEVRHQHFAFMEKLEHEGHLVAGGPIVDDVTGKTTGRGLFVMRGQSIDAVAEIVRADPFVQNGFRDFTISPWRMAEGEVLHFLKAAPEKL